MPLRRALATPVVLFFATTSLVVACGSQVDTVLGGGATSGGGGASSSSSSSSSSASSSSSTSSSSTSSSSSSSGAGGGAFCGGKVGIPCPADQYCAYEPPGTCGYADGGGVCKPRPMVCDADCPGVCACTGQFFCNACGANAAGFDVSASGACLVDGGTGGTYSAEAIFTNVPRFAIFKADPVRDVCFRLVLGMSGGGPSLGVATPAGWSIEVAEVTNHASDCALLNGGFPVPPLGLAVPASSGTGAIVFSSPTPCLVTIHATLSFPKGAAWVPLLEPLDADSLQVSGGCPP